MSLIKLIDILESDEGISGWQLRETRTESDQLFLNKDGIESVRNVDNLAWDIEILVHHEARRQGKLQKVTGNARFQIDPSSLPVVEEALKEARFAASLVANEPYVMAEVCPVIKPVPLSDPALETNPAKLLREKADLLREAAGREELARLGAGEFFADRSTLRFFNSQGVQAAWGSSLVSGELVLHAARDSVETEVFRAWKRRRLDDYDLAAEVALAADIARKGLVATLPQTGNFDVIFSGEALDHFFTWFTTQASASAFYNKLTQAEPGIQLVETGDGTALNLWHDARIPYGVGSCHLDASGVPATRKLLISKGQLYGRWAESRWAQYLGMEATGGLGNIVVEPGIATEEDIFKSGQKPVYHLYDFSYFEPDGVTGEFSAEIRAGEVIIGGVRKPIRGGSVSGRGDLALKGAVFSKAECVRERYRGPAWIRCSNLTLAGGDS